MSGYRPDRTRAYGCLSLMAAAILIMMAMIVQFSECVGESCAEPSPTFRAIAVIGLGAFALAAIASFFRSRQSGDRD
ncbi:hypothetical protein [Allosphingosinicella indica]|uniref:Uncharacterized protein n=1 Tax=Allosphingosinicella indica TaxID=941907 RepID=A0A1X7G890_9SPHN|nr:hypothetical protein [Allosphingosinicella indica]SMF65567.1 hypothetical protein SAMN06295910_1316 [Allosphingosinicella indica]